MSTVQVIGVPNHEALAGSADAVVVALKSRTAPVQQAVDESLAALRWLQAQGARQFFFKYCSTFDSTDEGNIGPVADALLDEVNETFTIACPAFPTNKRTIFRGHLFVGDQLLSDSGMRHHPLTPMTDSNLVGVLGRQSRYEVGLVDWEAVNRGSVSIAAEFETLRDAGYRYGVVDAICDDDLVSIGSALSGLKLITGGSGVALGLPDNYRCEKLIGAPIPVELPDAPGAQAVLCGSCSVRTLEQVATMKARYPSYEIDPLALGEEENTVDNIVDWAEDHIGVSPFLIYSSAPPDRVSEIQAAAGKVDIGHRIEQTLGQVAIKLVDKGITQLVVAGGETSGAVVQALGVKALKIGPEIDPGVPWTETVGTHRLALALKSGNFGGVDFFEKSLGMLK